MVTGAGGVLGGAVVAELVSQGHRVVAVGRAMEDVRPLEEAHPAAVVGQAADLTDPDAVDELWQRLDSHEEPVDFLVNVAGGFRGGTLVESSPGTIATCSGSTWTPPGGPVVRRPGGCGSRVAAPS